MENITKHDVRVDKGSVEAVAEFDALVELLKVQNPIAYAQQMANGELEAFRKTLKGGSEPKKEEAKEEDEKVEKLLKKSEAKKLLEEAGQDIPEEASREELDALARALPQ